MDACETRERAVHPIPSMSGLTSCGEDTLVYVVVWIRRGHNGIGADVTSSSEHTTMLEVPFSYRRYHEFDNRIRDATVLDVR